MKKISNVVLGAVALLSVGCSDRYRGPVYVSSAKYEETSCKELISEFHYFNHIDSCAELKEYFFFILPTEYEKLSCKQLHTQFIKINQRYEVEEWQKEQDKYLIIGMPIMILTTGGLPLLDNIKVDSNSSSYLDPNHISENITAKEAYKTLKDVATKKNCSFVKDMRDIK